MPAGCSSSWAIIVVGLGVLAPRVETALSGAGWQDSGSQSVQARNLIQANFAGNSSSAVMVVVHSPTLTTTDAAFASAISRSEAVLRSDRAHRIGDAPDGWDDHLPATATPPSSWAARPATRRRWSGRPMPSRAR